MEPRPAHLPRPRHRHRAAAVVGLLVALLLTGCGLRLEAPPPAEPVPDTVEIVRRTAVSDALYVADQADAAVQTLDGSRRKLTEELERVATEAREQADELGGVYDSGLEPETRTGVDGTPETSPSEAPVGAQDVVDALADASGRSRIAAGTTDDGPLARLLASVGAAQAVSARRVGGYTDAELPPLVTPVIPEPDPAAAPTDGATAGGVESDDTTGAGDSSAGETTATVSADPDESEIAPADGADAASQDGVSSTVPDSAEPAVVPRGLTAADLRTLVESEDSAGYALRLRAARTSDEARERLEARADVHTSRGQAWALIAGTDGTDQDPRQVAYAVPREGKDAALVHTVENRLATGYASLVGTTAADTRTVLVDLLVESAVTRDAWGAEPEAFPGLPEQREND